MSKEKELILCVPTKDILGEEVREGFWKVDRKEMIDLIEEKGEYKERGKMEEDESWQQIIPQIILKVGDKIFIHRIPSSGNEGRLHDMWPIFLGGHVNKGDDGIEQAALREFEEELDYKGKIIVKEFVGIVNLDDVAVSKVHVGLVWVFEGDSDKYELTEDKGIEEGVFVSWEEAEEYKDKMTYWSRLAFDKLRDWYAD